MGQPQKNQGRLRQMGQSRPVRVQGRTLGLGVSLSLLNHSCILTCRDSAHCSPIPAPNQTPQLLFVHAFFLLMSFLCCKYLTTSPITPQGLTISHHTTHHCLISHPTPSSPPHLPTSLPHPSSLPSSLPHHPTPYSLPLPHHLPSPLHSFPVQ